MRKIYDVNKQDYRIATKNFELNQQIETYLQEVGTLIVHPDVVDALQHIKDLGAIMRKQNQSQSQSQSMTTFFQEICFLSVKKRNMLTHLIQLLHRLNRKMDPQFLQVLRLELCFRV